jgi:hypothetical protein
MTLDGHSLLGPDQPGRTPSRLPRDESSRHGRYAAGAHVWPRSLSGNGLLSGHMLSQTQAPSVERRRGFVFSLYFPVMAGLAPAIHVFLATNKRTWIPATRAGMTKKMEMTKGKEEGAHGRP